MRVPRIERQDNFDRHRRAGTASLLTPRFEMRDSLVRVSLRACCERMSIHFISDTSVVEKENGQTWKKKDVPNPLSSNFESRKTECRKFAIAIRLAEY
jgi:hypothetical protein